VHLSDGGHFENLAAFEMLRRQCSFILIVDAGCDPDYMFEDLGNLQRLARVDLNAKIEFSTSDLAKFKLGGKAFTIGKVTYRNKLNETIGTGVICYIKPTMLEKLQPEIESYHRGKTEFPHETTLNQFFTESQFLAYLALGQIQGQALVKALRSKPPSQINGW
jgi:hypothetical protein